MGLNEDADVERQTFEQIGQGLSWPVPKSAYIHLPFCRHRCGYCNFSVVAGRDDLVDRVIAAIDTELAKLDRPELETLFLGGGTPTHLSSSQLERLFDVLHQRLNLAKCIETTVEGNPEDITTEKVQLLFDRGVNRVSLGVQSFDNAKLQVLERGHSGNDAREAIEKVAEKIANVSIDLIFAAPGESLPTWNHDLQTALSLPIKHLSTYTLTYEQGTRFWSRRNRGMLTEVGEDREVAMYQAARETLSDAEWRQYEISSFAKSDTRCRHNLCYWLGRGWYAAGPGAARFVDGKRQTNHRSTFTYLKRMESGRDAIEETEILTRQEYMRERLAFGMRMIDGVDLMHLASEIGDQVLAFCQTPLERMTDHGWVKKEGHRIKLTPSGLLFADAVAAEFLEIR